jgi:hypothetical protein
VPAFALSRPQHVVDAFYRVRFGRKALDNHETQAIERAILEIEGALEQEAGVRSQNGSAARVPRPATRNPSASDS